MNGLRRKKVTSTQERAKDTHYTRAVPCPATFLAGSPDVPKCFEELVLHLGATY
jgi:hypothetical protein